MSDLLVVPDERLDDLLKDRLQARIDTEIGDLLGSDDVQVQDRIMCQQESRRESYALNVWLNNGWEHPKDPEKFPDTTRDEKRIKYPDLVKVINRSAKKAAEKLKSDMNLADAMTPADAPILIPKVIVNIVREAAEPVLVGTRLFRTIRFQGAGETIVFPATGAFTAADIGPGEEYPERQIEFSGQVTAKIGKSGVKIRMTEEVLRYSMFDVMTLHLQAAGRALARHKETKIFDAIQTEGSVSFDNATGGTSVHGRTAGRALDGNFNNGFTVNDLFTMFADLMNAGFVPNVLLMNPMGWLVFARDPVMRNLAFQAGSGSALWQRPSGAPGLAPAFQTQGANMTSSAGRAVSANPTLMQNATLQTAPPGFFPIPFSMVVSPFVDYDASAATTTIHMADVNHLGLLIVDEEPTAESWDDPNRDILATKIRERYTTAIDNEGDAVTQAKGISLQQSFDFEDRVEWQAGTGALPTGTG